MSSRSKKKRLWREEKVQLTVFEKIMRDIESGKEAVTSTSPEYWNQFSEKEVNQKLDELIKTVVDKTLIND